MTPEQMVEAYGLRKCDQPKRVVPPARFPLGEGVRLPGLPVGQTADYRFELADGTALHLQSFPGDTWMAHLDAGFPGTAAGLVRHLAQDTNVIAGLALGTTLALLLVAVTDNRTAGFLLLLSVAMLGATTQRHCAAAPP